MLSICITQKVQNAFYTLNQLKVLIEVFKILIVEDEPIIATDIQSLLVSEGYQVIGIAHRGEDALDMLSTRKPDFAMLDINLDGQMTGIDVAEHIHDNYKIPYLFLTSFDDEKTLSEAQQYAPYGFLVKPFQDRTLLASIKMASANFKRLQTSTPITKEQIESQLNGTITDQEFLIITNLQDGKSYKQIAIDNFISVNTVKYHVKNIYSKFNLSGRAELATRIS
jgi:DNA-binding NarL/FixJ family response regulator